jgi:hypothetical protein
MNCCYSGLRIHVDITELDIPDDENLIRERNDMIEEDDRMFFIRRFERRTEETRRRAQEDLRRMNEANLRNEELIRIQHENIQYAKYRFSQSTNSIYYTHPLTIDNQLNRRIVEEARWKEEDLRIEQENQVRKKEDQQRKKEDMRTQTRRILVKPKRRMSKRYTLQELTNLLKRVEKLKPIDRSTVNH